MWQYRHPDELYHYGVLGMKWGVRKKYKISNSKSKRRLKLEERFQKQGMSKTESENAALKRIKIEKIIAVTGALTLTAAAVYATKKTKNKIPKKFVDDILIKKGTVMNRVTKTMETSSDYTKRTFVADEFMDKALYKGTMPAFWKNKGYDGPFYQNELKAVTNIIAPSKPKNIKILEEVVSKNPKYVRSLFKDSESMSKITDKELVEKYFKKLSGYIADSPIDDPLTSSYLNTLSEKGYKAVVDWNDADGFAKKPLILLDAKNDVKIVKQYILNQK